MKGYNGMSKAITVKPDKNDFNYACVDEDTASKLEYFAKSGKALIRKSQIQFMADMGKLLSEARDLLASHKSGTFIKWATAEFDVDKATVYRYVNVWDRILSQACDNYLNWSQSALYLASSEDFPKPVMKKLEKIPATDLVRTSDVKRLIEASKPTIPDPDPDEVPFDTATSVTPAQQKKLDAEKKKADAAAAATKKKEKAAADRAAKKLADAAAKEQKKKDDKAAKDKSREEAAAAKLKALPKDEQISFIKSQIQQHLGKMVRLLDELNGVKPNRSALNANLKACEGIKLW